MAKTEHFYDPPYDSSNTEAVALWGHVSRMLLEGGPWNGEGHSWHGIYEVETTATGSRVIRTRPKRVQIYADEYISEPNPGISNLVWTAKLIKRMRQAQWNVEQVRAALSREENVGGSYYRFRCAYDKDGGQSFLASMYEGSFVQHPYLPTTSTLGEEVVGGSKKHAWRVTSDGFQVHEKPALRVLAFVLREGAVSANQIQRSGVISGRAASRYVKALVEAGLLTQTRERHLCANGKRQPALVTRAAETVPDIYPAEDSALWRSVSKHGDSAAVNITLQDFGIA